jgi:uncharacterized protein YecT (DUF1311 family)
MDDKYLLYVDDRSYFELADDDIKTAKYMILEEMKLRNDHMRLLDQTQKCTVPQFNEEDYKKADAKLNVVYKQLRQDKTLFKKLSPEEKTLKLKDILKTELAWIKYKEAMAALGHLNCPNINKYSWSTILTQQRIEQLEDLPKLFS